jgi:hypothetical protein
VDEILLSALGVRDAVRADTTYANLGAPYRVGEGGGQLLVADPAKPVLTLEAGVTLRFSKGASLRISSSTDVANGALRAEGTAEALVTFTSAEAQPLAGDWSGLVFAGKPDPQSSVDHAKIAFAGGFTGVSSYGCPSPSANSFENVGGVVIYGGQPAAAFVKNASTSQPTAPPPPPPGTSTSKTRRSPPRR